MISHLALEQFLLNRPSSERAAWQEKWESSGRDMEAFMEDLGDEGLRPPSLVHVSMEGQEALFSENMPLGQVLAHLQEQRSAAAPMELTPGTPFRTPPETPRPTAPGDADEDGDKLSSPDPPLPVPPPPCSSCRERALRVPQGARCPGRVHAALVQHVQVLPPSRKSLPEAPREAGGARKLYRCDQCPRVFGYLSRFQLHQRRHNNERPFACATCGKGFFQASDLHVHQLIHTEERPFRCGCCDSAFSHWPNLRGARAHPLGRQALRVRSVREDLPPVLHLPPPPADAPEEGLHARGTPPPGAPHPGTPRPELPPCNVCVCL